MFSSIELLKVVIPWYTGAISNPSDLKNYFHASFNTHQFSVIEVSKLSLIYPHPILS